MTRIKKISIVALLGLVTIQFIRPSRNTSARAQQRDIVNYLDVPVNIANILKTSCYDCHSNNTSYPWYANIQPAGWLLARHVKEGKRELNFNEFSSYSPRRQLSKLKSILNSIKDGSMPLSSYTLLHRDAKLSPEDKALLVQWSSGIMDSLSASRE